MAVEATDSMPANRMGEQLLSTSESTASKLPLVLQRYELNGSYDPGLAGAHGFIVRGVDTQTGQRVAIKLFDRMEKAVHEASVFQALVGEDQTNLIGYHGFDPDYGEGALVLEAAEQSLADVSPCGHPPSHDCTDVADNEHL